MRRYLLGALIPLILLSSSCGSSPTTPTDALSAFAGLWQNVDPQTGGITQIMIRTEGSRSYVHAWGACFPTYCDWGEIAAEGPSGGTLSTVWNQTGAVRTQTLTVLNGQLQSVLHTHFTDNSGRADYDSTDVFNKVS